MLGLPQQYEQRNLLTRGPCAAGADMTNAVLDRVSFDGADLTNVKFVNAVITGSTFKGANLSGSVFEDALIGNEDAKRL